MNNTIITEWFNLYSDDIYNFLIYYMGSSDVEDLVQEVFIKAIKGIDSFNQESQPKTWLFSIARNVAIDEMRKKRRFKWVSFEFLPKNHDQKIMETPDEIFEFNETKREIYNSIQLLKQSYQEVLVLKGIEELSVREVAYILNWSENKVRVTYHRAIKALKKEKGGMFYAKA